MEGEESAPRTAFEKAIAAIETATCGADSNAPSCNEYRLRPSEEAALLQNTLANPPPPWGIKINLSRAFLGPEKCRLLGRKLILNKTVTYLDLSMCDMQEEAAELFFACIAKCVVLKHLSVNGNYIGNRGAIAAAPCLARLESFHCASNGITDVGASALAEALRHSTTLKTLSVRNNRITAAGITSFMRALEAPQSPPPCSDEPVVTRDNANAHNSERAGSDATVASDRDPLVEPQGEAQNESSRVLVEESADFSGIPVDAVYNETLHTLWIDQNVDISEDMITQLATILAKRYPKPPETKKKKGKKAKAK